MALAAQLEAWAARSMGPWTFGSGECCNGELGGAPVVLRATAIDDDACEVSLSGDGENCLRLSVSLSTGTPFFFALDAELNRLAELTNEVLERGCGASGGAGQSPLGVALDALCAAAARSPALVAPLRAPSDAPSEDCDDSDGDSSASDGWYGDDCDPAKVRATHAQKSATGPSLTNGRTQLSASELSALQASFLFRHAADAKATVAAAPPLSAAALPHLRIDAAPEACAVYCWIEVMELPTPGVASALGLAPDLPLRLTLTYAQSVALKCACAADVLDGAVLTWDQPDAPKPPSAHESGIVLHFGLDTYLPALAKDLSAAWRSELQESPAKRSRRASNAGGSNNAFVWLISNVWEALASAASNCAVCRTPLPAPGARLAPCTRDVCLFNFEEMGGCPLLPLLREAGGASAALHCTLAHAAACSSSRDTFEPFPSFLLERAQQRQRAGFFDAHATGAEARVDLAQLAENKQLGRAVIAGVLCSLPPLAELAAMPDEATLRRRLMHHNWHDKACTTTAPSGLDAAAKKWGAVPDMAWRVLQFVLSTPHMQLQLLEGTHKLEGLPADVVQLAIVNSSDAREQTFQARREAAGGSFFAFHGSNVANWYSIMRNGLRSLSRTAMMANGAAYGEGVYLAANMSMSMGYTGSRLGHGDSSFGYSAWQRAAADFAAANVDLDIAKANPVVLALGEVTNTGPQGNRHGAGMHVVGTDDVALRYILVIPSGSYSAEAAALRWNGAEVGHHIAALRQAALEAAEAERARLREPRRLALQAKADQAGASAVVDAAVARLDQATTTAASATAARAVLREYRELDRVAPALGLGLSLIGDDVFRWRVLMHNWKDLAPGLHDDLRAFAKATGLPPAIELEFVFSSVRWRRRARPKRALTRACRSTSPSQLRLCASCARCSLSELATSRLAAASVRARAYTAL